MLGCHTIVRNKAYGPHIDSCSAQLLVSCSSGPSSVGCERGQRTPGMRAVPSGAATSLCAIMAYGTHIQCCFAQLPVSSWQGMLTLKPVVCGACTIGPSQLQSLAVDHHLKIMTNS